MAQSELSRDYSIIFGVAAVYIFILALLFLVLEFLILLLYRRCSDRLTRLALAKNLIASAAIVPSLIPSRRHSPRSTPRCDLERSLEVQVMLLDARCLV